jgi:hypothetical protein
MSIKAVSWALEYKLNDPIAKLVLIGIADKYNDERGFAWPSVSWLATAASCSDRTVRRKLKDLERLGLLAIDHRFNDTSCYRLLSNEIAGHTGDTVTGGDTVLSGGTDTAVSGGTDTRCPPNNKNNNNDKHKKRGKQKLTDWEPTVADKEYAESLELDWQEVLTDIRLWDEKNGNKAAYASCKAFWQGWCRKDSKRTQRASNRQQSVSEGRRELSERQKVYAETVTERIVKAFGHEGYSWKLVHPDVVAFMESPGRDEDWLALGNGLPNPKEKGWM